MLLRRCETDLAKDVNIRVPHARKLMRIVKKALHYFSSDDAAWLSQAQQYVDGFLKDSKIDGFTTHVLHAIREQKGEMFEERMVKEIQAAAQMSKDFLEDLGI